MQTQHKQYRMGKCRSIMKQTYATFKKKKKKLAPDTINEFEQTFRAVDTALLSNDQEAANTHIHKLEALAANHLKRNLFDYTTELVIALTLALLIATVVRQTWFELYEIPTGSMRPTFEEKDRLTVSKTAFGINIPFANSHFYFDESLVQRGSVVIFSGENVDLPDTDTRYFWLFPAKKRYIKRMIGKPGDTLYFYGGKIYGVDKNGKAITDFDNAPWLDHLEHIPFLSFDGKLESADQNQVSFKQMNLPIGRLINKPYQGLVSQIKVNNKWITADPAAQGTPHKSIKSYSDFFGIRNFAMTRLLTKEQLEQLPYLGTQEIEDGILYLEIAHHPSVSFPPPNIDPYNISNNTIINTQRTVIPLQKEHLDRIMDAMYTARFTIKNHFAARYSTDAIHYSKFSPRFPNVSDGTYEFYYGKGWQVGWGGILSELPMDHPLYNKSPENIQLLYNLGIDLLTIKSPTQGNVNNFPHRYAYFRNGDLYLLGQKILSGDDPTITKMLSRENDRAKNSLPRSPYIPFKDYGAPIVNGEIDTEFIQTFGVTVPENHYLVLGDNHAMSADSRVFGFISQDNLEGAPSMIIWPIGDRIGPPLQKPYPFINLPRAIVWMIALVIGGVSFYFYRRQNRNAIFKG
ncbi:MAG: signal peptidase I [Chlamydiota bacterium]|nr:signal peptidase I [Chlamydiota bacterium]